MASHTGTCLCGDSKVELGEKFDEQIVCHCNDCKKTSGSAFSTNVLAAQDKVKITGPVGTYDIKAPSGNTVTRVFCKNCGAALSHKSKSFGDKQAIQTGIFPDFANVEIKTELFVKDRWAHIAPFKDCAQVQAMP